MTQTHKIHCSDMEEIYPTSRKMDVATNSKSAAMMEVASPSQKPERSCNQLPSYFEILYQVLY